MFYGGNIWNFIFYIQYTETLFCVLSIKFRAKLQVVVSYQVGHAIHYECVYLANLILNMKQRNLGTDKLLRKS